jgi:hypothetical protein
MNMRRTVLALALAAGFGSLGSPGASAQGVQLFAVLNGGNEIDSAGYAVAGDPNGFGAASVILTSTSRLCFSILVHGIDTPTLAHIHEQFAGRNGSIVVDLVPPNQGNNGTSAGCVSGINTTLIERIRATPSRFYVNVHTTNFPGGAVRGQLF